MTTKKVPIDGDLLKPQDMRRARVMLGGRDPWKVMRGYQEDRTVLIAWCLLSRDNPDLTWDEVDDQTFGEFVEVPADDEFVEVPADDDDDDERPPEGPSSSNGSRPEKQSAKTTDAAPSKSRSSAASTT
jgi:hypothetical protein